MPHAQTEHSSETVVAGGDTAKRLVYIGRGLRYIAGNVREFGRDRLLMRLRAKGTTLLVTDCVRDLVVAAHREPFYRYRVDFYQGRHEYGTAVVVTRGGPLYDAVRAADPAERVGVLAERYTHDARKYRRVVDVLREAGV